jgi:hypothetical protein
MHLRVPFIALGMAWIFRSGFRLGYPQRSERQARLGDDLRR